MMSMWWASRTGSLSAGREAQRERRARRAGVLRPLGDRDEAPVRFLRVAIGNICHSRPGGKALPQAQLRKLSALGPRS